MAKPGFPLEIIAHNPRAMCLPAAGYGILVRMVQHFWLSECRPMPIDNDELFSIARAHRPTWAKWRSEVMGIISDLAPVLEKRMRKYEQQMDELRMLGLKGGSILSRRAAERRAARVAVSAVPVVPIVSQANRAPKPAVVSQANRAPKPAVVSRSGFSDR